MKKAINLEERSTFISIGAAVILISMAATIVTYVSSINSMAGENRERVTKLEQKRFDVDKRIFDRLNAIQEKLHRIEGYLEAKKEGSR